MSDLEVFMIEKKTTADPGGRTLQENKMGIMPIPKLLFSMAIPAICSMTLQAVYNIVDSIFVAQLSERALTAVTLVFPIQMLIVAVGVGTGVGLNSLISRRLGEKRFDEANSAATHGFVLAIFNWLVFLIFTLFFSKLFYQPFSDSRIWSDQAIGLQQYCHRILLFCISAGHRRKNPAVHRKYDSSDDFKYRGMHDEYHS